MTITIFEDIAIKIPFWLLDKDEKDFIQEKDWAPLIKKLRLHGLIPFFVHYKGLKHHAPPKNIAEKLQRMAQAIIAKNMHKHQIQRELANEITKADIPFLFFKGLGLSQMLYQNPYLRPLIDIDLLIKPEQEPFVRNLFNNLGCKEEPGLQNTFIEKFQKHGKPYKYKDVLIEIHTCLFNRKKGINEWGFLETSNDWEFHAFEPVFYLIYLCHHCFYHFYSEKIKMIWLIDIACLLQKLESEKKEDQIVQLSTKLQLEKETFSILHIVHSELGITGKKIYPLLPIEQIEPLNNHLRKILHDENFHTPITYYQKKLNQLSAQETIKYVLSLLFPSPEYLKARFGIQNKPIQILFYFINPFRIAFRFIFWKRNKSD